MSAAQVDEDDKVEWEYYDEEELTPAEEKAAKLASHQDAIFGFPQ